MHFKTPRRRSGNQRPPSPRVYLLVYQQVLVHMRVAISLLSMFTLLASLTFSTVPSSQAFVAACDKTKTPRYASWQAQAQAQAPSNFNIACIRSTTGSSSIGTTGRYRLASASSLLVGRATNSEHPNAQEYGDNADESKNASRPHLQPRQQFIDYQKRKAAWAGRYTSLESLRETFGTNKNRYWGDLDAASARRLYKTLLPKALLELVQAGVKPEDLAPLAYQARVAAKLYARERCTLPARLMANLFDGFRSLKRYGRWQPVGMSYEQVWDKYQKAVLDDWDDDGINEQFTYEDIAIRSICMRILEASTRTNERVDRWTLPPDRSELEEREDLVKIAQTLENDVRKLLHHGPSSAEQFSSLLPGFKIVGRWLARIRRYVKGAIGSPEE